MPLLRPPAWLGGVVAVFEYQHISERNFGVYRVRAFANPETARFGFRSANGVLQIATHIHPVGVMYVCGNSPYPFGREKPRIPTEKGKFVEH